ncbi:MAG: hypothetical protein K5907_06945 [Treponema sp.]|nr:hypothetical protein [Treponema sp.]
MKVKHLTLAGAALLMLMFTSCLSGNVLNFDYKERAQSGTPENSVIFIGFYGYNTLMYWSQCDSEYQPDYQQLDGPFIVSAPVAPGSRYRLEYQYGQVKSGNTITYWSGYRSMQDHYFDIKVPEEPGIYYFGYYNGQDSYRMGEPVKMSGLFVTTNPVKQEKECLEYALKKYKGTAWEPVIRERLEELK